MDAASILYCSTTLKRETISGSNPGHLPCLPQCAKITSDYQRRLSSRTAPGRTKHATMRKAIAEFLRTSYTCLLLVSPEIRRFEHAADELLFTYAWPHLSLGQELGPVLLPELFPFRFTLTLDHLCQHPRFAVQRQGAGRDILRLILSDREHSQTQDAGRRTWDVRPRT
jgi:hypothetical protein